MCTLLRSTEKKTSKAQSVYYAYDKTRHLTFSQDGNKTSCYNGDISSMVWKADAETTRGHKFNYDSNGNMQQDYNKKISKIQYNLLNLPATLQFTNGNRKDYTYSADGKKLKVVHRTAIANISVPMGQIKELAAN